jgi:hypothetical protein
MSLSMHCRAWIRLGVALSLVSAALACSRGDEGGAGSGSGSPGGLLDGGERSLIVVGDSSSYVWPRMLQEMLDEHTGGERRLHVLNAVVGGSPVGRWIADPDSDDYDDTFGAMLRDFFGPEARLRGAAPEPSVALCLPSLQHTGGPRGPIAGAADAEGIRVGADALERLAVRLHEHGIERVYVSTGLYNESGEPETGHERLARGALLERGHEFVAEGPDLWTATRDAHPGAFHEDGVHPNQLGMKVMAEQWYRTLAGEQARQEIVDRLYATEYDLEALTTDYINGRRP